MLNFVKEKTVRTPQGCGRQIQPPALSVDMQIQLSALSIRQIMSTRQPHVKMAALLQKLQTTLPYFLSWET